MTEGPTAEEIAHYTAATSSTAGVYQLTKNLVAKARALVDILDEEERNHGGLVRTESLRAKNELRLELSRWK